MLGKIGLLASSATLILAPLGLARADDPVRAAEATKIAGEDPGVGLLDAARSGVVSVEAEGAGGARMTLRVTNRSRKRLKVVLPPGWWPRAPPGRWAAWADSVAVAWAAAWVAAWAAMAAWVAAWVVAVA